MEPCSAASLSLFESGAHVDGSRRSVRLNLVNHARLACRLSGYPSISLLRPDGSLLGNVLIEKVTATTLEAEFAKQSPHPAAVATVQVGAEQTRAGTSPVVMLAPAGEATFEVGWTSGAGRCDQVGSIAVAAPGMTQSFSVSHPLSICEGRILVTAVSDNSEL